MNARRHNSAAETPTRQGHPSPGRVDSLFPVFRRAAFGDSLFVVALVLLLLVSHVPLAGGGSFASSASLPGNEESPEQTPPVRSLTALFLECAAPAEPAQAARRLHEPGRVETSWPAQSALQRADAIGNGAPCNREALSILNTGRQTLVAMQVCLRL